MSGNSVYFSSHATLQRYVGVAANGDDLPRESVTVRCKVVRKHEIVRTRESEQAVSQIQLLFARGFQLDLKDRFEVLGADGQDHKHEIASIQDVSDFSPRFLKVFLI